MRELQKNYDTKLRILMEMHTSGDKASSIIKIISLKGNFIQEAQGHSGGIWCLWDCLEGYCS